MILTLFESVQKAYSRKEQVIDASWPDIAEFLTTFNPCETKDEMQLFNLWQFNPAGEPGRKRIYQNGEPTEQYEEIPGTIRRCKANAELCYGLILDYDGETKIDDTIQELSGFAFAYYTSFRHSEATHKYRVVLPFKHAVTPEQFKRKKESISQVFQKVDHASFSESQSFYLHSGPDETIARNGWFTGEFLDLELFADEIVPERLELPRTEYTGDTGNYKAMLIESLATCSGLHYSNLNTKHGVLTLVALCKSADFTFSEYDMICHNMADPDSSLQDATIRKTAWMGWTPYTGISKSVREEFIKAHNGRSRFGTKPAAKTAAELKEQIIKKWGTGRNE